MTIKEEELFMGVCFILSAFSKDKEKTACLVVKNKRIVSSGFNFIETIGDVNGSPEHFAFSPESSLLEGCDIYLNYTPTHESSCFLLKFLFRKLVYFHTKDLSQDTAELCLERIVRFDGNLNWIRDHVSLMKHFDIFS
jgi:hypothetical protein